MLKNVDKNLKSAAKISQELNNSLSAQTFFKTRYQTAFQRIFVSQISFKKIICHKKVNLMSRKKIHSFLVVFC